MSDLERCLGKYSTFDPQILVETYKAGSYQVDVAYGLTVAIWLVPCFIYSLSYLKLPENFWYQIQ